MTENKKELGIIEDTKLGFEDHGFLTFMLYFDFGGTGQGFGGWSLGGEFTDGVIRGILKAVGVDDWSELKGKEMWVIRDNNPSGWASGKIIGIESPKYRKNTKPFNIEELVEKMREEGKLHEEGETR